MSLKDDGKTHYYCRSFSYHKLVSLLALSWPSQGWLRVLLLSLGISEVPWLGLLVLDI